MDALLRVINDGFFRCYFDGSLFFYNPAFLKLMGINESIHNSPLNFYDLITQNEALKFKSDIAALKKSGKPQKGIFKISGNNIYCEYYIALLEQDGEQTIGGKISDISEQMLREQSMRMLITKEKEINNFKSNFIRITSHELRTPLAVILSNSEILQMLLNNEIPANISIDPSELLNGSIKKVFLMTEILDQLMMFSRIESDKIEFNPETTNISQFIIDLKDDFYNPYIDGRVLTLRNELSATLQKVDKKLFRHTLINLINNAFKYSAGKPPPILTVQNDEENIYIEIKDFGIGIPDEEVGFIYNNFYRASNVGAISGAGIGLLVVDYSVKKHGGSVSVKSSINKGTAFTIIIPVSNDTER